MKKPISEKNLERKRIRHLFGNYLTEAEYEYYGKLSHIEYLMMHYCYNQFYDIVSKEACEKNCDDWYMCATYDVKVVHGWI